MIAFEGDVKLTDFGIAKRNEGEEDAQHAKLTRQGMVLGTPPYMSPEQFTGKPLRPTSDIYSLAIVAYEMMTTKLPFQAQTPWEWATRHLTAQPVPFESHPEAMNNPPYQKAAVMRALSKKPEERPQSMQQFLQEFTGNAAVGNDWSQATSSAPNSSPSASARVWSGWIVTGFTTMPDSNFLTLRTSLAWAAMSRATCAFPSSRATASRT